MQIIETTIFGTQDVQIRLGTAITKGKTLVPVCSPKLISPLDGVDIWMGDHLDRTPCVVLLGKSGWHSGLQSRLPPLLEMLYVD